jgi:hypothetical protein
VSSFSCTHIANADSKQFDETVDRISACPILAKEQYVKRHDRVCVELYCNISKEIGGKLDNKQLYGLVPKLVGTGHEGKVIVLWNQPTELLLTINRTA